MQNTATSPPRHLRWRSRHDGWRRPPRHLYTRPCAECVYKVAKCEDVTATGAANTSAANR